ncbi:MAG: RidA family protein [Aestuariivirga sp.]|nr:RidA family protein [Aestuariivirga sp.]
MKVDVVELDQWSRPSGYSHATIAEGRFIFVSGQLGQDNVKEKLEGDFLSQVGQALKNVAEILYEAGSCPKNIVRMTWYVLDKRNYIAERKAIGSLYKNIIGGVYPAMTLIEVGGLLADGATVEIEVTAVI